MVRRIRIRMERLRSLSGCEKIQIVRNDKEEELAEGKIQKCEDVPVFEIHRRSDSSDTRTQTV